MQFRLVIPTVMLGLLRAQLALQQAIPFEAVLPDLCAETCPMGLCPGQTDDPCCICGARAQNLTSGMGVCFIAECQTLEDVDGGQYDIASWSVWCGIALSFRSSLRVVSVIETNSPVC